MVFACFYDKIDNSILSYCLKKIKFWNPFTGKIKKAYEDPMNNEITALTMDTNMKRAFLGDNTGKIKCFNLKNGKYLKDLIFHNCEVNILVHSLALNIVCSCSIDNIVIIHNDSELTQTEIIRKLDLNVQVKALSIMDDQSRLVIGLSSGLLKFYDIEHFRYDSDLHSELTAFKNDITCLFTFSALNLAFVCYSSGTCKFIWTPPHLLKFNSFHSFEHTSILADPVPVSCVDFDPVENRIYIGDQIGCITCYDFSELVASIEKNIEDNEGMIYKNRKGEFTKDLDPFEIRKIYSIRAHNEAIKHVHFADIIPKVFITTSHDLKIKIFEAETGEHVDELKQIANKFTSVPVGINYRGVDPLTREVISRGVLRTAVVEERYKYE